MTLDIDQDVLQRPILAGEKCIAEYIDPLVPAYQGNPLIETLPEYYSPEEVVDLLTEHPKFSESQRSWPSHVRMQCVEQLSKFMQPMGEHVRLEQAVSSLIRVGYEGRNPLDPSHARQFTIGFRAIREAALNARGENLAGVSPTACGFTLIGVSGIGKSTAVNRILQLYPQVLQHTQYRGKQLILKQLVWLKLECPASGSLKVLCQNFFRQVDLAVGTNGYREHVKSHSTKETMVTPMAQVAARQGLGLLVIDEVQRLRLAKNGGEKEALNFFTELVNTIGVPVVLIGTYRSMFLFNSAFAEARRATGQIDPIWSPMENGAKWRFFMKELWQFQWIRNPGPLTDDILNLFYEETQGITDIAVKLFKLAQWEAITLKTEAISLELVKNVADKYLKLVRPLLQALKSNDEKRLCAIDLKPDWGSLNDYIKENGSRIEIQGALAKQHERVVRQQKSSETLIELMNIATELGMSPDKAQAAAEQVMKASKGMADPGKMKKQMAMMALEKEIAQDSGLSGNKGYSRSGRVNNRVRPLVTSDDPWKSVLDTVRTRGNIRESLLAAGFLKPPSELNL